MGGLFRRSTLRAVFYTLTGKPAVRAIEPRNLHRFTEDQRATAHCGYGFLESCPVAQNGHL
jgi:hypothetical protein